MKNLVYYLISILLFVYSCGSDNNPNLQDQDTVQKLTNLLSSKEEFISALNIEISAINNSLNEISKNNNLDQVNSMESTLDKIEYFDHIITSNREKITKLESQKSTSRSSDEKELLNSIVGTLKQNLAEKQKIIDQLRNENDTLRANNIELKSNLTDAQIIATNAINSQFEKEREINNLESSLQAEKLNYEREKIRLKNDLNEAKINIDLEKGNAYFEMALELKNEFDNTKPGLISSNKNNLRKGLINKSYIYFRKSCLLGIKDASKYIRQLLTEETYSKELSINRSISMISECGI